MIAPRDALRITCRWRLYRPVTAQQSSPPAVVDTQDPNLTRQCRRCHIGLTRLLNRCGLEFLRPVPSKLSRRRVRLSCTASIIRIIPRLVANLDIDPHSRRTPTTEIPYLEPAAPDGVLLPSVKSAGPLWLPNQRKLHIRQAVGRIAFTIYREMQATVGSSGVPQGRRLDYASALHPDPSTHALTRKLGSLAGLFPDRRCRHCQSSV